MPRAASKLVKKPLQTKRKPRKVTPKKQEEPNKNMTDDEISTPEIEEIRAKMKQKLKPSEKMKLARQKRELIKQERIRLGIYEESESESESDDDLDMNQINQDLQDFNDGDNQVVNNNEYNIDMNNAGNDIGDAVKTLVKNSLDMQKNPQNKKDNMANIMTSVNQIIENVMSNVGGNRSMADAANNKVNIYVKNGPNDEPQVIDSFDFNNMSGFNSDFNENFKNFMKNDNENNENNIEDIDDLDSETSSEDEIEIEKPKLKHNKMKESKKPKMAPKTRGRKPKVQQKQIDFKKEDSDNDQNNDQKIHDKAKVYTNYKNNMINYLDSMYDSEDDMDFDALAKKKEAEENGVNLSELLTFEDDKETEENIIELDLSDPDLDNFRSLIDSCEDFEKLVNALNISIKEQAIRERNIQYISRRIKNLVNKMVIKEVKECDKKDKPKKKNVKGGINDLYNVSAPLCRLLGYPKGAKKAWTTVTKDVWNYITEKGLKDPDNNAMIIPNNELKKCLNIKKDTIRQLDVSSYVGPLLKGNKNKEPEGLENMIDDEMGLDIDDVNIEELNNVDSDEEVIEVKKPKNKKKKKQIIVSDSDEESTDSDSEEEEPEPPKPKMKSKSTKTSKSAKSAKYKLKK